MDNTNSTPELNTLLSEIDEEFLQSGIDVASFDLGSGTNNEAVCTSYSTIWVALFLILSDFCSVFFKLFAIYV